MVRTRLGERIRLCIAVAAVILGMLTAGSVPVLDAGAMGPEVSRVAGDSVYATRGSPVIAVGAAGNACSGYTQRLITRWVYGPDTPSPLGPTAISKDAIIGAATAAAFHGATKLLTPTTPRLTPPPTPRATGQRIALGLGDDLDDFASAQGAITYRNFPGHTGRFADDFYDFAGNPRNDVLFNLDGVRSLWSSVQRVRDRSLDDAMRAGASITDWELAQIYRNDRSHVQFFHNGQRVASPFG